MMVRSFIHADLIIYLILGNFELASNAKYALREARATRRKEKIKIVGGKR